MFRLLDECFHDNLLIVLGLALCPALWHEGRTGPRALQGRKRSGKSNRNIRRASFRICFHEVEEMPSREKKWGKYRDPCEDRAVPCERACIRRGRASHAGELLEDDGRTVCGPPASRAGESRCVHGSTWGVDPIVASNVLGSALSRIPRVAKRAKEARVRHGASKRTVSTPPICRDCPVRKCTIMVDVAR